MSRKEWFEPKRNGNTDVAQSRRGLEVEYAKFEWTGDHIVTQSLGVWVDENINYRCDI